MLKTNGAQQAFRLGAGGDARSAHGDHIGAERIRSEEGIGRGQEPHGTVMEVDSHDSVCRWRWSQAKWFFAPSSRRIAVLLGDLFAGRRSRSEPYVPPAQPGRVQDPAPILVTGQNIEGR